MSSRVCDERRGRGLFIIFLTMSGVPREDDFGCEVSVFPTQKVLDHPQVTHDMGRKPGSKARWVLHPTPGARPHEGATTIPSASNSPRIVLVMPK